jgi:LPXTG-site transpeptidase (sortase) family protein
MTTPKKIQVFGGSLAVCGLVGLAPIGYYWLESRSALAAAPGTSTASSMLAEPIAIPKDQEVIAGKPLGLSIPSLGLNLPVVDGAYDENTGKWTLSTDKAHFALPSVSPNNYTGNTLVYGHNRKEVFAKLHLIQPGALATITTDSGYTFTYEYASTQAFDPADTSIFAYQGDPRLTIQTCSGAFMQNRQMYYFAFKSYEKSAITTPI